MTESGKAVFLSYASQDVEAAKKICDALRGAGIEVWFDQSELVGGDAWDQKIRGQIKTCALFLPVISATTNARREGYFRREWKIAVDRTHDMDEALPFLVPVVIDDTSDAGAFVPEKFREVQWTRLPGGETPPAFCARVKALLNPEPRSGAVWKNETPVRRTAGSGMPRWWWALPIFGVTMALVLVLKEKQEVPPAVAKAPIGATASAADQLVAQAWAQLNKVDLARAELGVADGFCKRATELEPTNANAWAAWSHVDSWLVYHNLDDTLARRESARTKAAQALQLAPQSYEARLAQACYLVRAGGGLGGTITVFGGEAQGLLAALLQEQPAEPRALLAFGLLQRNNGKIAEARATFEKLAENPAYAAQAWNEIGWAAYISGDSRGALVAADRSIALRPCWPNLSLKFFLAQWWLGDLDLAQETLERIPIAVRQEDHGVATSCVLYWARHEPRNILRVLEGVSREWLRSNAYDGPTAVWKARAHDMAGRRESARLQWQAALQQVEQRLATRPDGADLLQWKGRILAILGQHDEAERLLRLAGELGANSGDFRGRPEEIYNQILLGHESAALDLVEAYDYAVAFYRHYPAFESLQAQPRFQAKLARLAVDPRYSPAVPLPSSSLRPATESH